MCVGPLGLDCTGHFDHFTSEDLGKTIDGGYHASWDGLRQCVIDNATKGFFAQLGSLEKIVSLRLHGIESINQYAVRVLASCNLINDIGKNAR
jgi:hypothetical protein